ncbi:hypothetical protein B5F39_02915 [Cloacibacillus sp. An23]|nr:NUDIX hydrolase [Cloacibacillus sp. An23]OUO94835.1 hypothetical protein B5F39_02915 [Cloacibacillus sp. An23]
MQLSCATLIYCRNTKRFLIVHPTNSPFYETDHETNIKVPSKIWGLPKGIHEDGEDYLAAALRELKEETDIDADADKMIEVGRFQYKADKDLYVYLYIVDDELPVTCVSTFLDKDGMRKPENDGYKYVTAAEMGMYMNTKMYRSIGRIIAEYQDRGVIR